jgi:hypothetical protein
VALRVALGGALALFAGVESSPIRRVPLKID